MLGFSIKFKGIAALNPIILGNNNIGNLMYYIIGQYNHVFRFNWEPNVLHLSFIYLFLI